MRAFALLLAVVVAACADGGGTEHAPPPAGSNVATELPSTPGSTASQSVAAASPSTASASAGVIGLPLKFEHDSLARPPGIPASGKHPVVLFLHGLGATGSGLVRSFDVPVLAQKLGFEFVAPDGPKDQEGRRFWNTGHACCDFDGANPPHVAMLGSLLDSFEKSGADSFDDVVVVGFSNGAFMAHRLACDLPRVTAIVAFAGAEPRDDDRPCHPEHPVRVIMIHGEADHTVPYAGGAVLGDPAHVIPSAWKGAADWALRNGCSDSKPKDVRLDLTKKLPGTETRIETFIGCKAGVELWSIADADHLDVLDADLLDAALTRVLAKP